jgi:hypothetical protein
MDSDSDGDGLTDHEEGFCEGHASYSNPAYLRNAVSNKVVTITAHDGAQLQEVRSFAEPAPPPPGSSFPLGFFDIRLTSSGPGTSATVTLTPPDDVLLNTWWKYGPTPENLTPHWYTWNFNPFTGIGAEFITDDDEDSDTDRIILHFIDGQRGDDDLTVNGFIVDPGGPAFIVPPPRVESIVINDGHVQRSMVNGITVTFSDVVTLDPGAFVLQRNNRGNVGVTVRTSVVDEHTVAVLTFSGRNIIGGSLADGNYTLYIHADKIHGPSGLMLDGDRDGTDGGDRIERFFRLFGDTDGDNDVDRHDRRVLKKAGGSRVGDADYLWYLDHDEDGDIDRWDWKCFHGKYHWRRHPGKDDC